jgi:ribosome biogenesis GTPase
VIHLASDKKKIRAEFRKNRTSRARSQDWTRRYQADTEGTEEAPLSERISGKGDLTRKRVITVSSSAGEAGGDDCVSSQLMLRGRVLSVMGLTSEVQAEEGTLYRCTTRRILKTLSTDLRHVVVAGDQVWFRPAPEGEGMIERVEPRHGTLSRGSRGRQHTLVTNVDQLVIVGSAAEPRLKPNLIDRFLVSADKCGLRPLVCINKVDLVDPADLQPLVGVFSQLGYQVLLVSAQTGYGIELLRKELMGRASAVAGQSGVGKSSLLNAVDPQLDLRVRQVSETNQKGRHTTTTARLFPLGCGGYVVDTPGIRQFQLWDLVPAEVAGYYRDLRPWINHCKYPNCTHTHEEHCAVKDAVADGKMDARRYEGYCQLFHEELLEEDEAYS